MKIPFHNLEQKRLIEAALADVRLSIIDSSFLCVGWSGNENCDQNKNWKNMLNLLKTIPGNKLLLDHYLDGAIEAEADAICDGENVYIIGIMEHIRPCECTLEIVMRHCHLLI
jgi:hypothetical protein